MIVNECTVTLEEHWGSDLKVVNAARNSFDKRSDWDFVPTFEEYEHFCPGKFVLKEKDAKLIRYLATHNHILPFAHCGATLIIQVPIFLWRQLDRHRIGFSGNEAISEVSRRYVSTEPEFFLPKELRWKAENKKQGSGEVIRTNEDPLLCDSTSLHYGMYCVCENALEEYKSLLEYGVCEEQARIILPQNMMTQIWWTGSLLGWTRLYGLRAAEDAQKEVQDFAEQVRSLIEPLFPVSWKSLTNA